MEKIESVWEYPRPPRMEASSRVLKIVHEGETIAETARSLRILETSHPPVYYIAPDDVTMQWMRESKRRRNATLRCTRPRRATSGTSA